jgi:hypothetical protein
MNKLKMPVLAAKAAATVGIGSLDAVRIRSTIASTTA